ncbi:hypothetical protein [Borrelia hispanica]|uniref:hypothetical protein n=1 Tax=Borrelia hispanica TaxID=40835 RepID=UPI0004672C24|nr:hypothetical protein [Borrelia hispanica]
MKYIKTNIMYALFLFLICSCSLFQSVLDDKFKDKKFMNSLDSILDDNQKYAFDFFKGSLQDEKALEAAKKEDNGEYDGHKINFDYDEKALNKLLTELGNDKIKTFLNKIYIAIKAINGGTDIALSTLWVYPYEKEKDPSFQEKQNIMLESKRQRLCELFYMYSSRLLSANSFFMCVMEDGVFEVYHK